MAIIHDSTGRAFLLNKPRKEPTMKVFKHLQSETIIVVDEHYAIIEPKSQQGTTHDQINNARRRLVDQKNGIFQLHPELTAEIDPQPLSVPKEVDPDKPEPPKNPDNSQDA